MDFAIGTRLMPRVWYKLDDSTPCFHVLIAACLKRGDSLRL
jgi:hypothetical protein